MTYNYHGSHNIYWYRMEAAMRGASYLYAQLSLQNVLSALNAVESQDVNPTNMCVV